MFPLPNHRRSESICLARRSCAALHSERKTTAGCLFTAIGVLITMVAMGLILPVVGARNEYGLAFVVGMLLAAVVFNLAGRALVRLMFRSRLRFSRTYRHQ